ncbi:MAG TPA: exopolysaccharide biosynthesis polyprenyl glycosylphosphotransferase [Opitutaceae bacterium]|nr:exopolysaccharide biosynthesis polyprenyl glycosylphosphotransferase [Opitutaceae bacterium]
MITTRARGLANLHAGAATLLVGIFFWVYAEFIMRYVPLVRLSREVNLLPYFLCVVGGMALSLRGLSRLTSRFHALEPGEAARVASRQVGLMAVLTFTMMFATNDRSISRLFLGTFLLWCWIGLTILNGILPRLLARVVFQGGHQLPTVFIGRVNSFAKLNDWIADKRHLGVHPVGLLTDDPNVEGSASPFAPLLGGVAELPRVLTERAVAQVILLELPATDGEARTVIDICQEHGCRLLIHNNLAERYTRSLVPTMEEGRHFYTLQEEPLEDPLNRLLKRAFDVAVSLPVVVLVLPPLCLWVWLMQCLQAPGPVFHARERLGQRGKLFHMLKFRSMLVTPADAAAESRQARAEDERIFPFGRFLRRRSLDEFPQFWNVLVGEMSIVGPRPYMPLLDEEFRRQTHGYRTRHLVKPGITGLAQSLGYRGEILENEMLSRRVYWDVFYITNWSVWMDLQITARTLWQVIEPPDTAR